MGAEIKKKREKCPFFIEKCGRGAVQFCQATGRTYCVRDIYNYTLCEYYQKYRKSRTENTPKTATSPRLPNWGE